MSIYEDPVILIYFCTLTAIVGAVLGSFLNCAAYRISHGESFVKGRSHCPDCGHVLSALDLVPMLSYLMTKGKCRYCKKKISVRYPLTELFMAAMAVIALLRFDLSLLFVRNLFFGCILFCLSLVDFDIYEIPDGCHIAALAGWLITLPFLEEPWKLLRQGLIGALVLLGSILLLSLLMDKLLGKESMGGGDIKLLFVCGLYLGIVGGMFMLIFACLIGLGFVLLVGKKNKEGQFPFGPSLAIAAWCMLLFGKSLIEWYLGFLF